MRLPLFILLTLALFASGCGIKQLRQNIETTRTNTDILREKQTEQMTADSLQRAAIADLKRRLDAQDELIRGFKAYSSSRLDGIEQQIARLSSRLQDATGKFSDVAMGVQEMRKKVGDTLTVDTVSAKTALSTAEADYARGHFELAIAGYSTFLERWAISPYAATAYFGRGQSKLAIKDTAGAIADFRAAGTATPPGERTPTALWQLGKLFKATSNVVGAREAWKQIVTNFPDTPEAARAKEQLDLLKAEEKKGRKR